ncbi:MAG TPA: hypothetical protein VF868_10485 [Bacteroidia bacterium]
MTEKAVIRGTVTGTSSYPKTIGNITSPIMPPKTGIDIPAASSNA